MRTTVRIGLILFTLLFIENGLQAQPISLAKYLSDTTKSIQKEVAKLATKPFYNNPDSILTDISVLLAYETWSKIQEIDYFTPIPKRVDIFTHKAQSEWMLGFYKVAILEHYLVMESGVLPLLESSMAHFDSTVSNYGRVNSYMVGNTAEINRIDSAFAHLMKNRLDSYYDSVKVIQNFDPLEHFHVDSLAFSHYAILREEFDEEKIQQSLTYWLVMSLKKEKRKE